MIVGLLIVIALAPIHLSLDRHACLAPCELIATVTIPAHEDNRLASLIWIAGSSDWEITATSPPQRQIAFTLDEAGDQVVYAVLLRRDRSGKRRTFQDRQTVVVAAPR